MIIGDWFQFLMIISDGTSRHQYLLADHIVNACNEEEHMDNHLNLQNMWSPRNLFLHWYSCTRLSSLYTRGYCGIFSSRVLDYYGRGRSRPRLPYGQISNVMNL